MSVISRRSFLVGAGALGAVTALGTMFGCSNKAVQEEEVTTKTVEEKFGYCCQCTHRSCGLWATVEDGVLTGIEGAKERNQNRGALCPRPMAYPMYQYNPYRIKAPMKRTNPKKGVDIDPGWVEITWDEAFELAADVLKDVYDTNPDQLIHLYGFADRDAVESGLAGIRCFAPAFGTHTINSSKGQFCAMHYASATTMFDASNHQMDFAHSKYAVIIGKSLGMTAGFADGKARGTAHWLRNGGKGVFVDPICTIEASQGEWVPVKPSTELSFTYAILYSMMYELGNFDVEMVKRRSNAPYLIGTDKEYVRGASGKPQMWDEKDGIARDFDAAEFKEDCNRAALEGTYNVGGVKGTTVYTLFKACFATHTPEWAEGICTIPAAKIREIAKDLIDNARIGETIEVQGMTIPYRPSVVMGGRSITNHEDGEQIDMSIRFINQLLGNNEVPGGANEPTIGPLPTDDDGIIKTTFEAIPCKGVTWPPRAFDLKDIYPHRHSTDSLLWQVISEGPEKYGFEFKPRVLFSAGSNSVTCTCNPDTVIDALGKLEYIIYACCYHMDETAMMADLLLPSHSRVEGPNMAKNVGGPLTTEREDFMADRNAIMWRDFVDPIHNTMRGNDIIMELADRIGILPDMNELINGSNVWGKALKDTDYALNRDERYTMEDIWDRVLKVTISPDYSLEQLKKDGMVHYGPGGTLESAKNFYVYRSMYSPDTRKPFYLMDHMHSGQTLLGRFREIGLTEEYLGYSYEYLEKRYAPLPFYPEAKDRHLHNAPAEYDLYTFLFRKPMFLFRFGGQDQNCWNREWSEKYDSEYRVAMINTATAKAKGLKDGDMVIVESYNAGKVKVRLRTSELVHHESLGFSGALGRRTHALGDELAEDPLYAELLNGHVGYLDPIHGGTENTTAVKIYKAE
jgi:anaerobic selenocysteine-containing dehydrogenase